MRMAKLKSRVSLVGALHHNTRDKIPANADASLVDHNYCNYSAAESLKKYTDLLPKKVRKNAVHAVEVVMTASPEWFEKASKEKKRDFYDEAQEWARNFFGKKNVLSVAIHRDEKTPHLHVICMPLVDGELNAKKLIGGSKYRMQELQDDFYKKVGKPLGMDRGIKRENGESVRHTQPKEFTRIMAEQTAAISQERKDFEEEKRSFNTGLFKDMNKDFIGVFQKFDIHPEETALFWKSVFQTMANFKAIQKESLKKDESVDIQKSKGKKL